jgi:hypothetical protein
VTSSRAALLAHGLRLEYLTVGWNLGEGMIAVGAGLTAGSIALIGFGVDSFVESISGGVLIWRLRAEAVGGADEERIEHVEHRASRLVAVSLLILAAYVAFEAVRTRVAQDRPDASPVGRDQQATVRRRYECQRSAAGTAVASHFHRRVGAGGPWSLGARHWSPSA